MFVILLFLFFVSYSYGYYNGLSVVNPYINNINHNEFKRFFDFLRNQKIYNKINKILYPNSNKNVLYLAKNAKQWKDLKLEIRNCLISLQQQLWTGLMFLPEKYIKIV